MKHPVLSIVLNSIAILVVGALLAGAIILHQTGGLEELFSKGFSLNFGLDSAIYATSDDYNSGDATVSAEGIHSIDLGWAAGEVILQVGDGNEISLTETASKDIAEEDRLCWKIDNGTLKVRFNHRHGVTLFGDIPKQLTLTIPATLSESLQKVKLNTASATVSAEGLKVDQLIISTASGDAKLTDLTASTVDFDGASGKLIAKGLTAASVNADTASGGAELTDCSVSGTFSFDTSSGDLFFSGELGSLDADTASGDLELVLTAPARKLDVDSASGDLEVTLPADLPGLEVEMDGASGDLEFDFDVKFRGHGYAIYGDGSMKVEVDSASGDARFKLK